MLKKMNAYHTSTLATKIVLANIFLFLFDIAIF